MFFCVQWFEVSVGFSVCWYMRNCSPSLFKLSSYALAVSFIDIPEKTNSLSMVNEKHFEGKKHS
jgi:hypothetical protein